MLGVKENGTPHLGIRLLSWQFRLFLSAGSRTQGTSQQLVTRPLREYASRAVSDVSGGGAVVPHSRGDDPKRAEPSSTSILSSFLCFLRSRPLSSVGFLWWRARNALALFLALFSLSALASDCPRAIIYEDTIVPIDRITELSVRRDEVVIYFKKQIHSFTMGSTGKLRVERRLLPDKVLNHLLKCNGVMRL